MSNNKDETPVVPRAAVSVVVRFHQPSNNDKSESEPHYLLIQRGKEPNRGIWAFPGGRIQAGEATLQAARRELQEETGLSEPQLQFYPGGPFCTTDSIHYNDATRVTFHYLIGQCFGKVVVVEGDPPVLQPSDDALDAQWWSVSDIFQGVDTGTVVPGARVVIERAESLYKAGLLPCS